MATYVLPFEKPIVELEHKLNELRNFSETQDIDVSIEIDRMQKKITETRSKIYGSLTPWQKVQVARHPVRPLPRDYVNRMTTDFLELHGDRLYSDDRAIIGGFASIGAHKVVVVLTQKGRDTKSNLECNFGCAYPEGYRKALRLMKTAARFGLPVVNLIDTPGAFPGVESEERHIAEAIAVNLREAFGLAVPVLIVVTGEGGSGGALGIGVGDRVLILEHAYYSVISPEGCAAILWRDRSHADKAADALKLTAQDLLAMKLVDEILPEPLGGAHAAPEAMIDALKDRIIHHLDELKRIPVAELLEKRYQKFRAMGVFEDRGRS